MGAQMMAILADTEGGWQAIVDNNGIAISVTGMVIVFTALVVISLFISAMPMVLSALGPYLPRIERHGEAPDPAEQLQADEEQVVAAIGFVLHREASRAGKSSASSS